MHENGIIIRGLTSDSVLVTRNGSMRLANFEHAKEAEYCRKQVGDRVYWPPEMVQKQCYGKEADWWSFGIILFEMFTGTSPLQARALCVRQLWLIVAL